MSKKLRGMVAVGAIVAALVPAGAAGAAPRSSGNDDVIATGSCSAGSDWKLKGGIDNGQIEVEFEVDTNVNGQTWRVRLFHNGDRFFAGRRTTTAPSGSFEVRRVVDNRAGEDRIVARARNLTTDETCRGAATF